MPQASKKTGASKITAKKIIGVLLIIVGVFGVIGSMAMSLDNKPDFSWKTVVDFLFIFTTLILWGRFLFKEESEVNTTGVQYAGPFRRTIAILIDVLLVIAIIMAILKLCPFLPYKIYLLLTVSIGLIFNLLVIWFLFRFGATPGKMIMGIVVRKRDFSKIELRNAFLRSSVDLVVAFFGMVAVSIALSSINYPEYQALSCSERSDYLSKLHPDWWKWWSNSSYDAISDWWLWSEVIVMMLNKERRAIHDYIAGTVVVTKKSLLASEANAKHS